MDHPKEVLAILASAGYIAIPTSYVAVEEDGTQETTGYGYGEDDNYVREAAIMANKPGEPPNYVFLSGERATDTAHIFGPDRANIGEIIASIDLPTERDDD